MSLVFPDPNTGCWLWAGAMHPKGHGSLNAKTHSGFAYAHRYSYFIHKGDFDRSKLICHKCDVPWCVNPDHLYVGTDQDNMNDKVRQSRHVYGEKHPSAILTDSLVREIRKRYANGVSQASMKSEYGISDGLISMIINNKRWKHVK